MLALLPGETLKFWVISAGICLSADPRQIRGTLWVTDYRICFGDANDEIIAEIPITNVRKIQRIEESKSSRVRKGEHPFIQVVVKCKTAIQLQLLFFVDTVVTDPTATKYCDADIACRRVMDVLNKPPNLFFAYLYSPSYPRGWKQDLVAKDYLRLGIPNECWRISDVNSNYELCDSYPSELIVPKAVTDDQIRVASEFRTHRRFPVLIYSHKEYPASLFRSSQPMVGILNNRNSEDEFILQEMRKTNTANSTLYIIDARPHVNGIANLATGCGYESAEMYDGCQVLFMGIQNIHAMRNSHNKLFSLCRCSVTNEDASWLQQLESTQWFSHLSKILTAANKVAQLITEHKASVLIHCSDGWDRTPQISSIAIILIDPYYRTLEGFHVLIEKEWCALGHKFQDRVGHPRFPSSSSSTSSQKSEISPIFHQFLECIQQILTQCPTSFEFNEQLLLFLAHHVSSCQFGDFLCNNEHMRKQLNIEDRTVSIWSYIYHHKNQFENPSYIPFDSVLNPGCSLRWMCLWDKFYLHRTGLRPLPPSSKKLIQQRQKLGELESICDAIRDLVSSSAVVPSVKILELLDTYVNPMCPSPNASPRSLQSPEFLRTTNNEASLMTPPKGIQTPSTASAASSSPFSDDKMHSWNDEYKRCAACGRHFGTARKKVNCAMCKLSFCSSCISSKKVILENSPEKRSRTCLQCAQRIECSKLPEGSATLYSTIEIREGVFGGDTPPQLKPVIAIPTHMHQK